jgi:nucleotide-binding universal stress UspA family protein
MDEIVTGVDGSDSSKAALRWAVDEAKLRRCKVLAVHAWEAPPDPALDVIPTQSFEFVNILPRLQESAQLEVQRIVDEVVGDDSGVEVEAVAVEGPATMVLTDAARDAQLLVVGSRGQGSFRALLLGSVSQALAHHSPCPLVIHRSAQ